VHHVVFLSRGGKTRLSNLLLLCSLCRRRHKWHYADLGIMPMPGFPALVAGVLVVSGPT
jgi:5-methylcytosine-specific restriction endonuclease McrA